MLTGEEVSAIYAPLWKAVPETRPRDIAPGEPDWFLEYDDATGGWWFIEDGTGKAIGDGSIDGMVIEAAAHALCRVAALEWAFGADSSPDLQNFAAVAAHVANGDDAEVVRECLELHRYNSSPTSAPSPHPPHPPA